MSWITRKSSDSTKNTWASLRGSSEAKRDVHSKWSPIKQSRDTPFSVPSCWMTRQTKPVQASPARSRCIDKERKKPELEYVENFESMFILAEGRKEDIPIPDSYDKVDFSFVPCEKIYTKNKKLAPPEPSKLEMNRTFIKTKQRPNFPRRLGDARPMYHPEPRSYLSSYAKIGTQTIIIPSMTNSCGPVSLYHFLEPLHYLKSPFPMNDIEDMGEDQCKVKWNQQQYDTAAEVLNSLALWIKGSPTSNEAYVSKIKPLLCSLENDSEFQSSSSVNDRFVDVGLLLDALKYTMRLDPCDEKMNGEVFQVSFDPDELVFTPEAFRISSIAPPYVIIPTNDLDTNKYSFSEVWSAFCRLHTDINNYSHIDYEFKSCLVSFETHFLALAYHSLEFDIFDTSNRVANNRYDFKDMVEEMDMLFMTSRNCRVYFLIASKSVEEPDDSSLIVPPNSPLAYADTVDDRTQYEEEQLENDKENDTLPDDFYPNEMDPERF